MKKLFLAGSAFFLLAGISAASIPLGRGELVLSAQALGTYDSNLTGRNGSQDDYYGTFSPRVSYLRRAGKIQADANVSVSVQRYLDHTEFNSENVAADVSVRLSEKSFPNVSASVTASYVESFNVDVDLNSRIRAATTSFLGSTRFITGPRSTVSFQAAYANSDRIGASDQRSLSAEGTYSYRGFLDDTSLNLLYGYSNAESSGLNLRGAAIDQSSHSLSVGLSRAIYRDVSGQLSYGYRFLNRSAAETAAGVTNNDGTFLTATVDGPFLPQRMFPKIKSHLSVSYQDAETPGVNDPGSKQVTGAIDLTWQAREKTSLSLGAGRAQRLSTSDLTVVSSNAHFSVQQEFRYNLSGSAGATYNWETYHGIARKDNILSLNGSLNYTFGRAWISSATYNYNTNSSTAAISDFTRHVASVSLGYTF